MSGGSGPCRSVPAATAAATTTAATSTSTVTPTTAATAAPTTGCPSGKEAGKYRLGRPTQNSEAKQADQHDRRHVRPRCFICPRCGMLPNIGVCNLEPLEIGPPPVADPRGGSAPDHDPQQGERQQSQQNQKSDVGQPLVYRNQDLVQGESDKNAAC